MNFLDLVKMRHSVRNYETRAVEKEKLDYVLECVRLSPSAVNFQPWKFAVVTDEARLSQLKKAYPRDKSLPQRLDGKCALHYRGLC